MDVKFRSAGSRSHTRGSMTLKQTEGWLLLSSPGCPRLPTRQNLVHEGSTIGDALTGVGVPTDELFNCNNELFYSSCSLCMYCYHSLATTYVMSFLKQFTIE